MQGIEKLRQLVETVFRKPSSAPDGLTDAEAAGPTVEKKKTGALHDIIHLGPKGDYTLGQLIAAFTSGEPMNDRDLLLEHILIMLQKLPPSSGLNEQISGSLIGMLWNDLPHPAATTVSATDKYHSADGSGNNIWTPELGKAGSAYARSVQPCKPKSPSLPDPELVFDQLLRRRGPFREHPSGLNRLFFSFATIVIHELFQSNTHEPWKNNTSSYVDLSTLYGNNAEEQKRVRTYENGRIFPDTIASDRLIQMPPGVVAILIMFSRNHNHIASRLYQINELEKYKPWETLDEDKQKWQDNDIFQIARNINIGFFANVVLRDYVSAILNTLRQDTDWYLPLGAEFKIGLGGKRLARGSGNVVSVEFAVLYHWHAALSAADAKWIDETFRKDFGVQNADEITPGQFYKAAGEIAKKLNQTPAKEWTFGGLERNKDGRFNDEELVNLIKDCTESPAHALGARGVPSALKIVEIMSQLQARNVFNVCTLNEFRKYLNLTQYKSFQEWNPDTDVAAAAEALYGHIDNLELYPGLAAEETKPFMGGSGLCPGQTTGRGILDDAIALIRGDRFLTYDWNTTTLTNWGLAQVTSTPGGFGGLLGTLLFTAFPEGFTGTSTYALLPFYTPKAIKKILEDNKVLEQYDTTRTSSNIRIVGIHSYEGCKKAFDDRATFATMYNKAIPTVSDGKQFLIGWDNQQQHDVRSKILHSAFYYPEFEDDLIRFYKQTIPVLIKKKTLAFANSTRRQIDIVRDVCNTAPILWLAQKFAIPIKDDEHPKGLLATPELFGILLVLFVYCSFNILPKSEWTLRAKAIEMSSLLRAILKARVQTNTGGITEKAVDWLTQGTAYEVSPEATKMYNGLNKSGLSSADIVGDCIGMMVPIAGNVTQQATLLVDLFLSDGYEQYKKRIVELAHRDDKESDEEMIGWVLEGMRHSGTVPGLPRVCTKDTKFQDGDKVVEIKKGEKVLIAISKASMDPKGFPNPEKLDPKRPRHSYLLLGWGLHFCCEYASP
ncbi:linoleate diol synthase [Fimicolochytrium jonesii]|uniref:linoleate diol synthase n=1 Tax=Fimicolochytrium jonesii TaxID=1396493 RepID=UPI0022FEB7A8|nr:linoleate diol synthase [Fimicolochytrium jonesii]KAI8816475.1 linoleate diol synthase [Fimicolochytrium jonesii]